MPRPGVRSGPASLFDGSTMATPKPTVWASDTAIGTPPGPRSHGRPSASLPMEISAGNSGPRPWSHSRCHAASFAAMRPRSQARRALGLRASYSARSTAFRYLRPVAGELARTVEQGAGGGQRLDDPADAVVAVGRDLRHAGETGAMEHPSLPVESGSIDHGSPGAGERPPGRRRGIRIRPGEVHQTFGVSLDPHPDV